LPYMMDVPDRLSCFHCSETNQETIDSANASDSSRAIPPFSGLEIA
jgi:hypothetical protein